MAYTEHVVEIMETVNMLEVILQSMFARILTFSGWPGWLYANGYTHTEMTRLSQPCDKVVTTMSTLTRL